MKYETGNGKTDTEKAAQGDCSDIVEGVGEYDVAKRTANVPYPYAPSDGLAYINKSLKNWGKTSYAFAIELKSEKKLIGIMGLEAVNVFAGTATTGSWINKKYWRQGYITEAKVAINDFAFDTLKLRRLNSTVNTDNVASNAAQKKMGYVHEGVMRKAARSLATHKLHDLNLYGLLKEDWKKVRKGLIAK
ncbi:MAG: GNAT family N-acetyltransferase [Bacteroidetes bacterium]|nr:GNAT family N-acetyltransferase [Bacteroidota bacterium]